VVTVRDRLKWWREKSYYLGEEVSAKEINYIKYDSNGNSIIKTSVVVDLTIYTRSGEKSIERPERWVIPDSTLDNFLDKTAYKRSYVLQNKVVSIIGWFGRGRRRRR